MANARVYTVEFDNVAVSAVQDLFSLLCSASVPIEIHSISLGQKTATNIGNLRVRGRALPATVTQGSGGSVVTPQNMLPTGQASATTAHANDTVQATTNGTARTLFADVFNVINGYLYLPPVEDRPRIGVSQAFVFTLDDAPAAAETMSGTVTFGELV